MREELIPNTVPKGGREEFPESISETYRKTLSEETSEKMHPLYGVEFFERPANDIVETRQKCRVNNFPNTEFMLYRRSKKLIMFFGESWAYGGKIRDMVPGNLAQESIESVVKGITQTVGPKMSQILDCDLYQSTWPGDQTTNMFEKFERVLPTYIDQYSEIKVCIQVTDPHRCANACHIYNSPFLNKFTNPFMEDVGVTAEQWLLEYDRSFMAWADSIMQKHKHIEIVLWKNFNPWCISKNIRQRYKCKTPDLDWTTFNAKLDGVDLLEGRQISNPALLLEDEPNCMIGWCPQTPPEWKRHQLKCIEDVQTYWSETSYKRLNMNNTYPSPVSHRLWAMQLIHAGEWI